MVAGKERYVKMVKWQKLLIVHIKLKEIDSLDFCSQVSGVNLRKILLPHIKLLEVTIIFQLYENVVILSSGLI